MVDAMIPVVNPAGVAELLQFGLLGFALSRYSGCWVGLKCMHDTVNTAASIELEPGARDSRPRRLRAAAGRPQHPLARYPARPGGAAAPVQAGRGARVRPGQRLRPAGARQPERAPRHRLDRQVVSRSAPGARRPRDRPGAGRAPGPSGPQARPGLAARARAHARVRRRPRADRRGRGEARADRDPAEGAAVRPRERAADRGQARRARRAAVPLARRALEQSGGARARRAHPEARCRTTRSPRVSPSCAGATTPSRGSRARCCAPRTSAPAARTTPRPGCRTAASPAPGIGCHYMAQWMDRATMGYTQMGGEGANWVGEAPFSTRAARVPERRRRHLLPLRQPGHPRRGRGRRQHHLQDPLQRRRRDDRRPERRRPAVGPADRPRGPGRRRQAGGRGDRRAGQVPAQCRISAGRDHPPPRRAGRGAARAARDRGHHRPGLRPDLRRREAPPAQARADARSGDARGDQRAGVRGLRRLRPRLELRLDRAGRDRVRAQASDRPVQLQQGLFLPERLLPELRHGRGRGVAQADAGRCGRGRPRSLARARAAGARRELRHRGRRRRRHRGGHDRPAARHGRASRGQGRCRARDDRACAKGRGGDEPSAHRAAPGGHSDHAHRPGRRGPAARVRSRGRGRQGGLDHAGARAGTRGGQRPRDDDRRLHPPGRFQPAGRGPEARDRQGRGRARDHRRGHAPRHGAPRRCDRHQPVHGRGRVPEGPAAGVRGGDRAGDRAEPRGGRPEHARVPLGAARRPGSAGGRGAGRAGIGIARASRPLDQPGRGDRAPHRVPHRVSGRGVCRALPEPGRAGPSGRSGAGQGPRRSRRGGRALLFQAARLQGRVRGGAAPYQWRVPRSAAAPVRRSAQAQGPPGAALAGGARPAYRASQEAGVWPLGPDRDAVSRPRQAAARHRRSIRSATAPSGDWNGA